MAEKITKLIDAVESSKEKLQVSASKLLNYYLTRSSSPWDENTTIENLRPINALVIRSHNIAWEVKSIEVLVSVDPDNYEDVDRLNGLIYSCREKVSWIDELFRHYVEHGSKKDSVLQIYNSMQSMHQSAKVMLGKSSQWIFELGLQRKKLDNLKKARYIRQSRKEGLITQTSSLSQISEEISEEDDDCTPMDSEPSFSGAEKGAKQRVVSTPMNVQDDELNSRNRFCEECKDLYDDLDELQLVVNAGGAYPSSYIATATYYMEEINVILERKGKLMLSRNFEVLKKTRLGWI